MEIKGLIVAAGCSTRMKQFKPLMLVNGYPMIIWAVMNLQNAGVREICVVVGCYAEKMQEILRPFGVTIVYNEAYQDTDMLASVKLGLKTMVNDNTDGILLLPGDSPMINPKTIGAMIKTFQKYQASILYPFYENKRTHPPLIGKICFQDILRYQGDGGIRSVLFSFEETARQLLVSDYGTSIDADNLTDFQNMDRYAKKNFGISAELCESLMDEIAVPQHIRRHEQSVRKLAVEMGNYLIQSNCPLDLTLIESGSLLHDILRASPKHAESGKKFVCQKGYDAVANVIGNHLSLSHVEQPELNEETIVFLADKLIEEDHRTSLEERYKKAKIKYISDIECYERITTDYEKAKKLLYEYEVITHEILSE